MRYDSLGVTVVCVWWGGGGMESPEAVHYSVDTEAHKYVPERRIGPTSIFFLSFCRLCLEPRCHIFRILCSLGWFGST